MKLLVILLVLALRRRDGGWPLWLTREERHQRFIDRLSPGGGALAWWLAVALPTLLVALLFSWLCGPVGALLTLLLGGGLLLWLIGVESEFRRMDTLLVRGRMNDRDALAGSAARAFDTGPLDDVPDSERAWFNDLADRFVLRAGDLFAVLFWVTVLGFGAALLFVLNRAWLRRHPEHSDWARSLDIALAWIPARLTALALALVGHFGMVAQAVSGRIWRLDDSRGLLTLAADAALGGDADSDEPAFQAGVNRLEALQELMLRALAVWLIFAALWAVLPT